MLQALAEDAIRSVALGLELLAAATIVAGAIWALVSLRQGLSRARSRISQSLLLALDFTIGADVLKVAVAPNMDDVLIVGAIVLIRIALTFTLVWELRGERNHARQASIK